MTGSEKILEAGLREEIRRCLYALDSDPAILKGPALHAIGMVLENYHTPSAKTVKVKAFCRVYEKGRFTHTKKSIWADNVNTTGIPCVIMVEEKYLEGWKPSEKGGK